MKTFTERAAEALDLLPEEMREPAVAYLFEQAEKFRVLKQLVEEGIADVEAGNVSDWNFEEFLREARAFKRQ
jgi:aryl-alcohol dehydrogenase-like predicted oxidoreductase